MCCLWILTANTNSNDTNTNTQQWFDIQPCYRGDRRVSLDINSNISLGNAETDIFGEFQTANNKSAAHTRNAIYSDDTEQ